MSEPGVKMTIMPGLVVVSAALMASPSATMADDFFSRKQAVEYVRICSPYGNGFHAIPGTDICIRNFGFIRYELNFNSNASGAADTSFSTTAGTTGLIASNNFNRDYTFQRVRTIWLTDTRSQTDFGTMRTLSYLYITHSAGASNLGPSPVLLLSYVQLAGLTAGRFKGAFWSPWSSNPGAYNGTLLYPDDASATTGVMYTHQFGNSVSASVGAFEPQRSTLWDSNTGATAAQSTTLTANPTAAMFTNGSVLGIHAPDIMANIQVQEAWGIFHLGGALHENVGGYYNLITGGGGTEAAGHPNAKWGFGVNAALNLKELPTGVGDQLFLNLAYSDGFTRGQTNNSPMTGIALYGAGASFNWSYLLDGTFAPGGQINTIRLWTAQAAFEHFWVPAKFKTSFYIYGGGIIFGAASNALLCARFGAGSFANVGAGTTFTCNFDTQYRTVGTRLTWYPVKELEIALSVDYAQYYFGNVGTLTGTAAAQGAVLPAALAKGIPYALNGTQSILTGALRVVHSW